MIVILFVLSGMCPVDHGNLFCLSLRLVIFRFRSWYAQDMAQSQSHQLSTLKLELGWATCSTVSASISLCTWGIGACTALAGTHDMARIHIGAKEMGCISMPHRLDIARSLPLRRRGSNIVFISAHCLLRDSSFRACHSVNSIS